MNQGNGDALLTTRLTIPLTYRKKIIARPRLYDLLEYGVKGPLTLIIAPAGSGKTTLISEWLHQQDRPAGWVSLEESDNNPQYFWRYLTAALKPLHPAADNDVTGEEFLLDGEISLIQLLNDLARLPSDIVLVLDDYHAIHNPAIHQNLYFFLEHLPPQVHLCIATREELPISLARLHVQGRICEINARDLSFTPEETCLFLAQTAGLSLPNADISTICQRTEGWAAGLQLLALSLHQSDDAKQIKQVLQSFSGARRDVLQYLTDEVLERQPPEVQDFLLATSILERLHADLCDAITGLCHGHTMLNRLVASNLFLHPLDKHGQWYAYAPLFRELLLHRLQSRHSDPAPTLHQRAATWCEHHNLIPSAIKHRLDADQPEHAADLIEQHMSDFMQQGNEPLLSCWLSSLPEQVFATRPALSYLHAWQLFLSHKRSQAEEALLRAEQLWQQAGDISSLIYILYLRSVHAMSHGDNVQALHAIQQARTNRKNKHHPLWHPLQMIEGNSHLQLGHLTEADLILHEGYQAAGRDGNQRAQTMGALYLARLHLLRGELPLALHTYHNLLDTLDEEQIWYTTHVHTHIAQIYYEWDNIDLATRHWQQGMQINASNCFEGGAIYEHQILGAQLAWLRGEQDVALTCLDQATEHVQHTDPDYVALIHIAALRVRYLLTIGNLEDARAHYHESLRIIPPALLAQSLYARASTGSMQARLSIAHGDALTSINMLQSLLHDVRLQGCQYTTVRLLILLALAHHTQGETRQTLQVLEQALLLARSGNYVRTFTDEGPVMIVLLQEFSHRYQRRGGSPQGVTQHDLDRLLTTPGQKLPTSLSSSCRIEEASIHMLSEREQAVLNAIAQGLSNQEIARKLVVTVSTVKTHLNNIYAKLHVHTRLQAVTRAYDLGILERDGTSSSTSSQLQPSSR